MKSKAPYRVEVQSRVALRDLETDALQDLRERTTSLRKRTILPVFIAYAAVGHVAVVAHVFNVWAPLGRLSDGGQIVSNWTILMALLLPAPFVLGPGFVTYVWLRRRLRDTWTQAWSEKGVPSDALARSRTRYG